MKFPLYRQLDAMDCGSHLLADGGQIPWYGELVKQDTKVETMNKWCINKGIAFAPGFFVNGHHLPDIYNVGDLQYFLSE